MAGKTLVTGAAGFIGSHVVKALLDANHEVRAFVRPGEDISNIRGLDIEICEGDVLDGEAVKKAVQGVDTLYHLAAVYAIWMKDWRTIYEVNIQGSRNVLWAALNSGVGRVVYTSSISAVGIAPGKALSNEQTPFNKYTLGNHYILTKYLSQQEALGFAENGLDLVVVNPAFPFGAHDIAPTPTGKLIVDILKGMTRFYYNGGINVIDVKDLAKGHLLAAEKGGKGEIYILGNENMIIGDFVRKVHDMAGFPNRRLPRIPTPLIKAGASFLTWWSDHVSHRPPLSTPKEVAYASQYLFFDNSKARQELGLELTPVSRSLEESIEWFRREGYAA